MRSIARTSCAWDNYNTAYKTAAAGKDPATRKDLAEKLVVPARVTLLHEVQTMLNFLLPTIISRGEMGTIDNVLAHSLIHAIQEENSKIEDLLQGPLPPSCVPNSTYTGQASIVVPVARTAIQSFEPLVIEAAVLTSEVDAVNVTLFSRPIAIPEPFQPTSLNRVNPTRNVFTLSKMLQGDTEYYLKATVGGSASQTLFWPAGAPSSNFVVVAVLP